LEKTLNRYRLSILALKPWAVATIKQAAQVRSSKLATGSVAYFGAEAVGGSHDKTGGTSSIIETCNRYRLRTLSADWRS